MNLLEIEKNQDAVIVSVEDHDLQMKLLELGFAQGVTVRVTRRAPAGGPLTVENGLTQLIIRSEDAKSVKVTKAS